MDNLCYVRSLSLLAAMERFKKSMGMTSRSSNSHVTPVHILDQNLFKVLFFFGIDTLWHVLKLEKNPEEVCYPSFLPKIWQN